MIGRKPEMQMIGPFWWHHHGIKMRVKMQGICNDILVIQGSAAELVIRKEGSSWLVSWKVIHSLNNHSQGQTTFENHDLFAAFGLIDEVGKFGKWLIDQYGGSAADQRKFIRYKEYLNIPCPGTGHDGDPNISIELDDEMKKAVMDLVHRCR